jgi:AcrR family transcriptional regulator
MEAVRTLLEEGAFNDSTMEQVAERAGVSRATLYQHFDSRLALVDAICDTFAVNPSLLAVREAVALDDHRAALDLIIENAVGFWASEEMVLRELYGIVAIDPSAQELVSRQRDDRRGEMETFARRLRRAGRLRSGLSERQALARLMVLTSFESYLELGELGLSARDRVKALQEIGHTLIFG